MKSRIGVTASLALVMSLTLAPAGALAGGGHGGAGESHGPVGRRPSATHAFAPRHPFFPPRPFFRHHFVRPFFPFGVIGSSVIVYAPPPVYYAAPAYYPPPAYYDSPVSYDPETVYGPPPAPVPPPEPPPMPSVVEYPNGRYELRGDGVTTPFTWVWIPNPPPPPPPAPPAPPAGAPSGGDPSPARRTELYRWVDEQGVAHWTDRLDWVPERYRAHARQSRPS